MNMRNNLNPEYKEREKIQKRLSAILEKCTNESDRQVLLEALNWMSKYGPAHGALHAVMVRARDICAPEIVLELERAMQIGAEVAVPNAVLIRLRGGERPLRVWRTYRGLTQVKLAELSGVNRVVIADIESGKTNGAAHTLARLASVLRVKIENLLAEPVEGTSKRDV